MADEWAPRTGGTTDPPHWTPVGEIPPGPPGDSWENLPYTMAGDLATRIGAAPYPVAGGHFEIVSVAARVGTAPLATGTVVDVNVNGASIYAHVEDQPHIAPGTRAAVIGPHALTSVVDGDYFTVDVDDPGAVPASDLTVVVRLRKIP